jgi:hypothetical protein
MTTGASIAYIITMTALVCAGIIGAAHLPQLLP